MATIRYRTRPGEIVDVSVREERCPKLTCFWAGRDTVRSAAGASGCSSRTLDTWSCGRREQTGCPGDVEESVPPRYKKRGGAWEYVG